MTMQDEQPKNTQCLQTCRTTVALFSPAVAVRHLCVPSTLSKFSAALFCNN